MISKAFLCNMVQLRIGLEPARKTPGQKPEDAEAAAVREKIRIFGSRWEVQSCAAGSADPSCQLQAAKALAAFEALLSQHKAVSHKPQTRAAAAKEVNWELLTALLAPTAPPAARVLALPAAASLLALMPEVAPPTCGPLLVSLLDPSAPIAVSTNTTSSGSSLSAANNSSSANRRDPDPWVSAPGGHVAAGAHAVTCIAAVLREWRVSGLQGPWGAAGGTLSLIHI